MAKIYKVSGENIKTTPKNGQDFNLEELKSIVGGHIEIIAVGAETIMVLNEDGKQLRLKPNIAATKIALRSGIFDIIVGDVLVCDKEMVK